MTTLGTLVEVSALAVGAVAGLLCWLCAGEEEDDLAVLGAVLAVASAAGLCQAWWAR